MRMNKRVAYPDWDFRVGVIRGDIPEYMTVEINFRKKLVIRVKNIPEQDMKGKIRPVLPE